MPLLASSNAMKSEGSAGAVRSDDAPKRDRIVQRLPGSSDSQRQHQALNQHATLVNLGNYRCTEFFQAAFVYRHYGIQVKTVDIDFPLGHVEEVTHRTRRFVDLIGKHNDLATTNDASLCQLTQLRNQAVEPIRVATCHGHAKAVGSRIIHLYRNHTKASHILQPGTDETPPHQFRPVGND